ncbi:cyanophycinase [Hamadaea tsunoensis]|uniref:cyanophycinase n=1 Tax=Hamadaea tsunoensis TaxID=53368 RepID=UPI0003FD276D|nr:cyanophycinase [Hamadaea tsunoensis]
MTRRRAVLAGTLGATTLGVLGRAVPATAAAPRPGPLVLVGGGLSDDNAAIYQTIVDLAGGDRARIGVLTAASVPPSQDPDAGTPDASNSAANGAYYSDLLRSYGAGQVTWIPVDLDTIANADDPALATQIDTMTGFFFGGGDQYRYVTCLLHGDAHTDSLVMAAIRRRHQAGAVVAGSSAGAEIQQGTDMVTGGESYNALRDGCQPGYFDDPDVSGYLPAGGFGLLSSGLIDTHFSAYGRLGRALQLARTTLHRRVYGLDPDTALLVHSPGTAYETGRVVGVNGVSILDLRNTTARWSYLTDGAAYHPHAWRAVLPRQLKILRPVRGLPVPSSDDVFADWAATDLARQLASCTAPTAVGYTRQTDPQFEVALSKLPGFCAYTDDSINAASFVDLAVTIRRR